MIQLEFASTNYKKALHLQYYHEDNELQQAYVISMGPILEDLVELAEQLSQTEKLEVGVVNARFIKPLDYKLLDELAQCQVPLIVYEESAMIGGLGTAILEYYNETNQVVDMKRMGVPDLYVQHGSVPEVLEELHLSLQDIKEEIKEVIKNRSVSKT